MTLTKAEILLGTQARKNVFIDALDGEVEIRPLTDGELHQIQLKFVRAVSMKLDLTSEELQGDVGEKALELAKKLNMDIDVAEFAQADYESILMAAAFGLSVDEEWSTDEIEGLPPGASTQIADEVYELSGARPEQEAMLRHFRGDSARSRDSASTSDGSPASSHASGPDAVSEDPTGRDGEDDVPDARIASELGASR